MKMPLQSRDRFFVEDVYCTFEGQPLRVVTLSNGGLFAATDRPPTAGRTVSMELRLGTRDRFPIQAKVAWTNEAAQPRAVNLPAGFGASILQIDPQNRITLLTLLRRSDPVMGDPSKRSSS